MTCSCGVEFAIGADTYAHTQVFDGFAVIVCFDCPACFSTRGILIHETVDDEDTQELAAE